MSVVFVSQRHLGLQDEGVACDDSTFDSGRRIFSRNSHLSSLSGF